MGGLTDCLVGGLEFKGTDSVEAEDFISAIRQKALAEGKEDDDRWTANFASACFRRDALRWHGSLDRETKKDWERLEKAILLQYAPKFQGIDGEECERFICAVRQRIYEEGKEDDGAWIARHVATRVVGPALRWHVALERSVKSDWESLQQAMLAKWSPFEDEESAKPR